MANDKISSPMVVQTGDADMRTIVAGTPNLEQLAISCPFLKLYKYMDTARCRRVDVVAKFH
jgi:hypothetical protein